MTKENAIFLGACSILGPSMTLSKFATQEQVNEWARNSIAWSKVLYEAVHGVVPEAAPEVAPEVASEQELAKAVSGWEVEFLIGYEWVGSGNKGLEGTFFHTSEAAFEAIKKFGEESLTYRVMSVPSKWKVMRISKTTRDRCPSALLALQGEFDSRMNAELAVKKHGSSTSFEYEIVRSGQADKSAATYVIEKRHLDSTWDDWRASALFDTFDNEAEANATLDEKLRNRPSSIYEYRVTKK